MSEIKAKVQQLYRFLKKANELRFTPVRTLADEVKVIRFAEIPAHPNLHIQRPIRAAEEAQEQQEFILRVQRPALTPCPVPPKPLLHWLLPGYEDPTKGVLVSESLNLVVEHDFRDNPQRVEDLKAYRALRVQDPKAMPPESIAQWLKEGWNEPERQPEVHNTLAMTETVRFMDDAQRVQSFERWKAVRAQWIEPELAARRAMAFYERMYDLYVTLEKDGENLELMVADGRLQWLANSEVSGQVKIDHPILLKRVELRFNPNVPEFVVSDTEREPELYESLFVDLMNVMPVAIRSRSSELEQAGYHPAAFDETSSFLRAFIQTVSPTKGEFSEEEPAGPITATPRLYRDVALVLRKRSTGVANAVDAIIEDTERKEAFPPALGQITGGEGGWHVGGLGGVGMGPASAGAGALGAAGAVRDSSEVIDTIPDDEILLAKEANEEQMQIIRRLDRSGSVIVQGPPGTGKTHTIGNLIGHLLAQGKSILVTAQTAKALRVVRDKVPEMLRPLAVSVLGSDQSARRQLESAISAITERMTADSPETLLAKASNFEQERMTLLQQKKSLKAKLRQALENEYREIKVSSKAYTPAEAARYVRDRKEADDWIPSPVKLGAQLTLSEQEIARAYSLGSLFTPQEETDCAFILPNLSVLPNLDKFRVMVSEYRSLLTMDLTKGADRWLTQQGSSESLAAVASQIALEFSDELRGQTWRPHAIVAGMRGETTQKVWQKLMELIEQANEAHNHYALAIHLTPRLGKAMNLAAQERAVNEILAHLASGGKLGFLQLMTRGEWKQFIKESSVASGEPSHKEHFEALRTVIQLESSRQALQPLWDMLIGERTGAKFSTLGEAPEQACRAVSVEIDRCLSWHYKAWLAIEQSLSTEGLRLQDVMATIARDPSPVSEYLVLEKLATAVLPDLLVAEVARRKLRECEQGFADIEKLAGAGSDGALKGCARQIVEALRARDPNAYESALAYAQRLHTVKPLAIERKALLDKLALVAPMWAEQIRGRVPPHHTEVAPMGIAAAWTWRQLHDELIERDALNANEIQLEIDKVGLTLREVTLHLIDAKAWGKQLERMKANNSIRQALVGWLDTMKVLVSTRQEDRRHALLSAARKLMKRCGDAVPVWVMPISFVAENFDPRSTQFDVVIIDEASQADLNALIPLYMGKQVIVVGDHEQVTPLGVGQAQVMLDNIRQQTLTDIPNAHLFDSKFSIYDIGRQAFGDGIRLVEHFRCVPEIISFSNQLSYDGKIRPLRESNSSDLKPACVAIKVEGRREKDINHAEARRIVDLIKSMIEHPRYAGKTIGVVSMRGDQQTHLLQSMIVKEIAGKDIEERRIIAGNSSEFQGDERDVILLSMVDSPLDQGPMRLTADGAFEQTKKRYNVAASRARDQLIVVHSFDPDLHLQANDLRMRLMKHIADPLASLRAFQQAVGRTESPFERSVLKMLTDAGYRVKTQWEVGYYRIDMVVEGGGKRLAIECDGDRYHPIEKLADDIERQTILERLGWQFVRIRGSAFYRDADAAMVPVFERLRELEIPQEADADLPSEDDMSLIHELDELIIQMSQEPSSADSADDTVSELAKEQAPLDVPVFGRRDEIIDIQVDARVDQGFDMGSNPATDPVHNPDLFNMPRYDSVDNTYSLLRGLGGVAHIESFLRDIAKSHGFQRLGRNVRDKMMEQVHAMAAAGKIDFDGQTIRIRKSADGR